MLVSYSVDSLRFIPKEQSMFLNFSKISFSDVYNLLSKPYMLNSNIIVCNFTEYQYLDTLFEDNIARTEFEEFLFQIIETLDKQTPYIYFNFKIKEKDLNKLIHNGFYEWLEYWLLFFKFTRLNWLIEMEDCSTFTVLPIEYIFVKRLDNPRISLFLNFECSQKYKELPEDINLFTILTKNNSVNMFPYANMWLI
jgi:hypothetical protein